MLRWLTNLVWFGKEPAHSLSFDWAVWLVIYSTFALMFLGVVVSIGTTFCKAFTRGWRESKAAR